MCVCVCVWLVDPVRAVPCRGAAEAERGRAHRYFFFLPSSPPSFVPLSLALSLSLSLLSTGYFSNFILAPTNTTTTTATYIHTYTCRHTDHSEFARDRRDQQPFPRLLGTLRWSPHTPHFTLQYCRTLLLPLLLLLLLYCSLFCHCHCFPAAFSF